MDEAKIDDVKGGVGGEGEGGEGGVRDTESSELQGAGCVVA